MKSQIQNDLLRKLSVIPGKTISLEKDFNPGYIPPKLDKKQAAEELEKGVLRLADYQDKLYAQNRYALLILFQGMDASGKDGIIKHVLSGINPQGCQVYSFKAPSAEELDHDYLWRCFKALPERGRIGIFNRSYFEEVLIVRVHPQILDSQQLPPKTVSKDFWKNRYAEINQFERYLVRNGILVLKFFLHISREEQKKRFMERIEHPAKNWKFTLQDVKERAFWNDYQRVYEDCLKNTSTSWAPWYVIPADHKYFARLAVMQTLCQKLEELNLCYPTLTKEQQEGLRQAKELLLQEK